MATTRRSRLPALSYLEHWPAGMAPEQVEEQFRWQTRLATARASLAAYFSAYPGQQALEELADFWDADSDALGELRSSLVAEPGKRR